MAISRKKNKSNKQDSAFLPHDAMLVQHMLPLCPSVCPSKCMSQAGIVSKPRKIESSKQRHTVTQGL